MPKINCAFLRKSGLSSFVCARALERLSVRTYTPLVARDFSLASGNIRERISSYPATD